MSTTEPASLFTVLNDKVLVQPVEKPNITPGGIHMPDRVAPTVKYGKVVSVGTGILLNTGNRVQLQLAKGDRIAFGSHAGFDIDMEGTRLKVLSEGEVLGYWR